jgi:hypothetical protein
VIEMGKQYKTRDGRDVRIYATDGGGDEPIHGAYRDSEDGDVWILAAWCADGAFYESVESPRDLIEVKPEREGWINVYAKLDYPSASVIHATKESADRSAATGRTACLHVKFREGDGL